MLTDKAMHKINDEMATYGRRVTAIRQNKNLSDQGRRTELAEVFKASKARLDALKAESAADIGRRQKELQQRLFGFDGMPTNPAAATSLRDAQDRVSAAKSAEALGDLMEQATVTGDQDILKAGFARAWRMSQGDPFSEQWRAVVDEYCAQNPHTADALQELDGLAQAQSPRASAMDGLATVLQPPAELEERGPAPYAEPIQQWA